MGLNLAFATQGTKEAESKGRAFKQQIWVQIFIRMTAWFSILRSLSQPLVQYFCSLWKVRTKVALDGSLVHVGVPVPLSCVQRIFGVSTHGFVVITFQSGRHVEVLLSNCVHILLQEVHGIFHHGIVVGNAFGLFVFRFITGPKGHGSKARKKHEAWIGSRHGGAQQVGALDDVTEGIRCRICFVAISESWDRVGKLSGC